MGDEKIKISWQDLHSADVDTKLAQQAAVARAAIHVQAQPHPSVLPSSSAARSSLLYNPVVYMALFGLAGGLVAWLLGELVVVLSPNQLEELNQFAIADLEIVEHANRGEISNAEVVSLQATLIRRYQDNPYVAILTDATLPEETKTKMLEDRLSQDWWPTFLQQLIWYSSLAIPLAFFLAIADQVMGRNLHGTLVNGSVGIVLGLLGGIVVGLFIDKLYAAMGGGQELNMAKQIMARAVGWAILGLFLAIAPGAVLRNSKRLAIGVAGGFLGGLLGGVLFDPIGFATGNVVFSRFVAISAIGIITGAGTGLIENAAKTGWLRVVAGLIAGKQFILYRNPTCIGSSPQCEVYLFKDAQIAPRHAAVHLVSGGFDVQDLRSASGTFVNGAAVSRVRLRNGDRVQIGATILEFREKLKGAQSAS